MISAEKPQHIVLVLMDTEGNVLKTHDQVMASAQSAAVLWKALQRVALGYY